MPTSSFDEHFVIKSKEALRNLEKALSAPTVPIKKIDTMKLMKRGEKMLERLLKKEGLNMKLILSPKDNVNKLQLKGVETFAIEGPTLLVVFKDGRCRNYPMRHLWYWESRIPAGKDRSKPPNEN